jgi:hypothetical protein
MRGVNQTTLIIQGDPLDFKKVIIQGNPIIF